MKIQKGKVWITSSKKIDGRYNKGLIVGHELIYPFIGFTSETQYFNGFEEDRYKVAYIDCFTNRSCCEWFPKSEISKTKPND